MLDLLAIMIGYKGLPFSTVLMDSWYATNKIMLYIDDLGKYYYCPLKRNRLVDDTAKNEDYKKIESLSWKETEHKDGKIIKIKRFPGSNKTGQTIYQIKYGLLSDYLIQQLKRPNLLMSLV